MPSAYPGDEVFADACAVAGSAAWAVLPGETWTIWWSPEMFDLFGLPREGPPPQPGRGHTHYHPDDTRVISRGWKIVSTTDERVRNRYRIIRPDGEIRHLLSHCQRRPPNRRGERWVVGMDVDITDVLVDQELLASERTFRFVAENTQDLILRVSPSGEIEFASKAATSLLGVDPQDLMGRNVQDFLNTVDHEEARTRLRSAIADGRRTVGEAAEYSVQRADGVAIWLESSPKPVYDGDGKYLGFVDVIRDISRRKALELEAADARRAAEAAAGAKSDFLANMSHELRTPLNSILGFGRLIGRHGGLCEEDQRHIALIQTAGQSLLTAVNDILDVSKLEAGGLSLDDEPFDVGAVVESVVALLSEEARRKAIDLKLLASTAPRVRGDAARLRQVLINLVANAVKFTDQGEVRVEFETRACDDDRLRLMFRVSDSGIGIPPDHQQRIFSRFTQVDGTIARRFGGTGLGLAICQKLVALMGGAIGVESDGRTGSCFWFEVVLPIADAAAADMADEGETYAFDPHLKILVAEDHPANRALLALMLEGFDVTFAENGAEAVDCARRTAFDIIFMDMQMPVLDGLGATRAIRALPSPNGGVPIVALTANVLPDQVRACLEAGMNGHVAKPIEPDALYGAIHTHTAPATADAGADAIAAA